MKLFKFKTVFIGCMLIAGSAFSCFAQQSNYSGHWKINRSKTQFGDSPDYVAAMGFSITQEKNNIVIESILLDEQSKEHLFKQSLTFDGKSYINIDYKNTKKTSAVNWIAGESSFMLSTARVTADGRPGDTSKELWSLEDEGKTLIVDRSIKQNDGDEYTIKVYYDKQP
jgi:hypothetical protein